MEEAHGAPKPSGEFEKQYDRQIRLWGLAAQQRMSNAKVLVVGIRGLAAEICKNLVLAGIGKVALMDNEMVQEEDLGCQFFLLDEHVGKLSRAEASQPLLQELNPLASVCVETGGVGDLSEERVKDFDLVCVTGISWSAQLRLDEMCRRTGTCFFSGDSHGLFASFFMNLNSHKFTIESKQKADAVTQKSTSETGSLEYPSLQQALEASWSKLKRVSPTFYALQVLYAAHDKNGKYIADGDEKVLAEMKAQLAAAHGVDEAVFNDELIKMIGTQAIMDLSAVCSIVAGMIADQIIKAVSGKDKPLCNYFVFDGREGAGSVLSLGAK